MVRSLGPPLFPVTLLSCLGSSPHLGLGVLLEPLPSLSVFCEPPPLFAATLQPLLWRGSHALKQLPQVLVVTLLLLAPLLLHALGTHTLLLALVVGTLLFLLAHPLLV